MKPKKRIIEKAIANGSIERVDELMSASQILITEVHNLLDESIEILADNHLKGGVLQMVANRYLKAAEEYFKTFATCVYSDCKKMDMFEDIDEFDEMFREWAELPKNWEPKIVEYDA